jgi:hypothetical protein
LEKLEKRRQGEDARKLVAYSIGTGGGEEDSRHWEGGGGKGHHKRRRGRGNSWQISTLEGGGGWQLIQQNHPRLEGKKTNRKVCPNGKRRGCYGHCSLEIISWTPNKHALHSLGGEGAWLVSFMILGDLIKIPRSLELVGQSAGGNHPAPTLPDVCT